jgi:hypothetical protein
MAIDSTGAASSSTPREIDRTRGLIKEGDGSLTLYVGHESPGADKESDWLPAPAAPFSLVYRIYGPSPAATRGEWKLPALEPIA